MAKSSRQASQSYSAQEAAAAGGFVTQPDGGILQASLENTQQDKQIHSAQEAGGLVTQPDGEILPASLDEDTQQQH